MATKIIAEFRDNESPMTIAVCQPYWAKEILVGLQNNHPEGRFTIVYTEATK